MRINGSGLNHPQVNFNKIESETQKPNVALIYGGPSNKLDSLNSDVFLDSQSKSKPVVALIYGGPSLKNVD